MLAAPPRLSVHRLRRYARRVEASSAKPRTATELGEEYPPYVTSDEERQRWDVCREIAGATMDGVADEKTQVWQMTRSLYQSDTPT